ncbi:zeta toxin family protein [Streptomyces sp. B-S-A8]|uniref:UDP-N-acetylglucosamine kinase n=1 Tax=Streptomyces solicavernae TaxID=3043614 RepID=A0ABT6S0T9_9ACTN|nr:zeta toxin family protein [Streptomyces sp. B-S-A8]MDI3390039.1 zeta toxin family protein [Streptomyces sp. B-S-A8]
MTDRTGQQDVLSQTASRDVLDRLILPTWTRHAVPQQQPVVVFVVGQPGAGKTQLVGILQHVLDRRGGAVLVGVDLYKAVHERYETHVENDVRTAGAKVRPDTRRWHALVEEHVRERRYDALVESALADPHAFRTAAAAYRRAGYRIEVVALAVPEAVSQLGVLRRFLDGAEAGGGRYVSWENHDNCAKQLPLGLKVIEDERLADRVTVVRRDLQVLYTNNLTDGTWQHRARAASVLLGERSRPWGPAETAVFREHLADADRRVHAGLVPEDKSLAVRRDAERVAALAEPVRRIAQPRAEAPGVDYHRLSHDEHTWIFDELIVPSFLGRITAQERPVVVFVKAQPGAGKTRAAQMVRRTLRGRPTWVTGDFFKANHPDYRRSLRENPRTASSKIRADYRAWQTQAEAYVRARRGDVLIEMAPGSVEQFLDSARPFHEAGYRVELVVLAVRSADSRQGTAARYAAVAGDERLPARFTTAAGHDRSFAVLPEAVRAAETSGLVGSVAVVRRDGSAVYRNERLDDGGWVRPTGAMGALLAEQERPYTEQEASRFLAVHRHLLAALPQYRAEVRQILWLARPLMPAGFQPGTLAGPVAVAALPMRRAEAGYSAPSSFRRAA